MARHAAQGRGSLAVLGAVLAAHAGVLYALSMARPQAPALPVERPILVTLVKPEPIAAPEPVRPAPPKPTPPKPEARKKLSKPVTKPTPKPMAQPEPRPAPMAVTQPEPQLVAKAEPTVEPTVEPAALTPIAEPSPPEPPSEPETKADPAPEPVEPPRFNADYLDNPAPAYPSLSRRMREQGRVLLRVLVDAEGRPTRVLLHRSSSYPRLDDTAIGSVRQWKFLPARQGGQPVEAWVIVPIQFSLRG